MRKKTLIKRLVINLFVAMLFISNALTSFAASGEISLIYLSESNLDC